MIKYLVVFPLHGVLRILRVELVFPGTYWRIGHLAIEIDQYLKGLVVNGRKVKPVFLLCRKKAANPYMLKLWEKRCQFLELNPALEQYLLRLPLSTRNWLFKYVLGPYVPQGRIFSSYEGSPLVEIPPKDHKVGQAALRAMGVPEGTWFACVHIREAGFLPDLDYHSFRDCDPQTFIPAMEWLVEQGGYVIRMGDSTMRRLPETKGIVDYAHSRYKSPFMDVYLCSQCRLFLGTSSGLFNVAYIFHRPVALTDLIPFTDMSGYPHTYFIPRIVDSARSGRSLTFREVRDQCLFYRAHEYEERGLVVHPNEEGDILDFTREAWAAMVEGKEALDGDPGMRDFERFLVDSGFSSNSPARIGRAFMRAHKELFS